MRVSSIRLSGVLYRMPGTVAALLVAATTVSAQNTFPSSGAVGIGTTSPSWSLEVAAGLSEPVIFINNTQMAKFFLLSMNAANDAALLQTSNGKDFKFYNGQYALTIKGNNGNVGIGNVSPSYKLDVTGGIYSRMADDTYTRIGLQNTVRHWTLNNYGNTGGLNGLFGIADETAGALRFWIDIAGNATAANNLNVGANLGVAGTGTVSGGLNVGSNLSVTGTGNFYSNVNISTNLGVSGTATVSGAANVIGALTVGGSLTAGSIAATYQDIAEWVDSTSVAPAGTVVVIDAAARNRVEPSSKNYDTSVAGVVSPQPGITLGEKGKGRLLIAHSGRVRVKVDASFGAIRAGDLLVTSPISGVAMRSQPVNVGGLKVHRPGTILGKALEPLKAGQGTVLTLLTLQ